MATDALPLGDPTPKPGRPGPKKGIGAPGGGIAGRDYKDAARAELHFLFRAPGLLATCGCSSSSGAAAARHLWAAALEGQCGGGRMLPRRLTPGAEPLQNRG